MSGRDAESTAEHAVCWERQNKTLTSFYVSKTGQVSKQEKRRPVDVYIKYLMKGA